MARLTIDDVKRLHRAAGKHFFDADTMRFWGTTMVSELFPNNTFVTEDDNYDRSKLYDPGFTTEYRQAER